LSEEARKIEAALSVRASGRSASSKAPAPADKKKQGDGVGRVLGATKDIAKNVQGLGARTAAAVKDPLSDPFIVVIGLLTLASAFLGAVVLYRVSKEHLLRSEPR
jgi:hypothetical protein